MTQETGVRHGRWGYSSGCRCDACRDGHRQQNSEYRARQRQAAASPQQIRADALSLIGLNTEDAELLVRGWTATRAKSVALLLAREVDQDVPLSRFGVAS